MELTKNNIPELPSTSDKDFWEDSEVFKHTPLDIAMCATHTQENWMTHTSYKTNSDGSISCLNCPWGTRIPGYFRELNGKIFDLRSARGE